MPVDESKRRRRGPAPLDPVHKRTHTVSVRLNAAEWEELDTHCAPRQMQRGEYLRAAAFGRLPPTVPYMNSEVWAELSRPLSNLNQIARRLNEGFRGNGERISDEQGAELSDSLAHCIRLVVLLRSSLIGESLGNEEDDEAEGHAR